MSDIPEQMVCPDGVRIAFRRVAGKGPQVVWLGGFRSEMAATKADALAAWARANGRGFLRFDYFGHGLSGGRFEDGTITRWRADALQVIDSLTTGPLILVGSSMGGWLACLAAMARPERVAGLGLIAPAADFTQKLLRPELDAAALRALDEDGVWMRPSEYGPAVPITRKFLEDGDRWSILPGPLPLEMPVRLLQGGADPDVPWPHALELASALKGGDVVFTLIKDGDHRLSRPQDLARLVGMVDELARLQP